MRRALFTAAGLWLAALLALAPAQAQRVTSTGAVNKTFQLTQSTYVNNSAVLESVTGGGDYNADTNAITGIRFFMNSGNISSGKCSLYGIVGSP